MYKKNLISCLLLLVSPALIAQRIVLLEQFTNAGCSICASHDPATYAYVDNNSSQLIAISYHTSFPYFDSMYLANPTQSAARTSFYNVVGVPYSIVDGNYYRNSTPNFNTVIGSTVSTRANVAPQYSITPLQNEFNGMQLQAAFAFQSLSSTNLNDSLRAFIVVIEDDVLKSSYASSPGNNSLPNYRFVMRRMIPGSGGSYLLNRGLNGIDNLSFTWTMQFIKNLSQLRIVAFVQNMTTKEIYNAQLTTPLNVTGIADLHIADLAQVFPNPATNYIYIRPETDAATTFELFDLNGRMIYENESTLRKTVAFDISTYTKGIYFLKVKTSNGQQVKKVIFE